MSRESDALASFPFLERFELSREIEDGSCSAYTLILLLRKSGSPERLRLRFSGVQDLRVGNLEGLFRLRFEIRPVRERQLEGLAFQVVEEEYEALSFFCSSFEAAPVGAKDSLLGDS
jgi:hypothetical protein